MITNVSEAIARHAIFTISCSKNWALQKCGTQFFCVLLLLRHFDRIALAYFQRLCRSGQYMTCGNVFHVGGILILIVFTVEDQGPGTPEESLRPICNKFYQADSTHKREGGGLGLALVEKILTLKKGNVKVKNMETGAAGLRLPFEQSNKAFWRHRKSSDASIFQQNLKVGCKSVESSSLYFLYKME